MKKYIVVLLSITLCIFLISCGVEFNNNTEVGEKIYKDLGSQKFKNSGLETDTDITGINLDLVLDGGPGKDGIPAIDKPIFYTIGEAERELSFLNDESTGIAVTIGGISKFYPYNILVWHEIVNDSIGNMHFSVTFCPLCGSAIVYSRELDGKILDFGVSGKLYQSNLLMYDNETESLWSQSLGEAIVGEKLGQKLEYIQSDLMSFGEFKKNYPHGKVLNDDTGFNRDYTKIPYGNYIENDELYFPVENSDERFHSKEMFYIVNNAGESVAFNFKDLREEKKAEIIIGENNYSAHFKNGIVEVSVNGKKLAGYYEMWFSWATHNQGSKNVWKFN